MLILRIQLSNTWIEYEYQFFVNTTFKLKCFSSSITLQTFQSLSWIAVLNVDPVQWLTSVSWREVLLLHFCNEYCLFVQDKRFETKWMFKYGIKSHNGIGVNIVYQVGLIFNKWISNMIFASQFQVSNVCNFNIESKSSIRKTSLFPGVFPVLQRKQCKLIGSNM